MRGMGGFAIKGIAPRFQASLEDMKNVNMGTQRNSERFWELENFSIFFFMKKYVENPKKYVANMKYVDKMKKYVRNMTKYEET